MLLLVRLRAALLPEYDVERELAHGGMGIVFLARDVALNRPVAVNILRPELATADAAESFVYEAQTAAKLRHPNIVPVHFAGERDGLSFYVMDYIEAPTLLEPLGEGRGLDVIHHVERESVTLAREMHGDDVRMAEFGGGLRLVHEALGRVRSRELGTQDVDGDGPIQRHVPGEEHDPHAAVREFALDVVFRQQRRTQPHEQEHRDVRFLKNIPRRVGKVKRRRTNLEPARHDLG